MPKLTCLNGYLFTKKALFVLFKLKTLICQPCFDDFWYCYISRYGQKKLTIFSQFKFKLKEQILLNIDVLLYFAKQFSVKYIKRTKLDILFISSANAKQSFAMSSLKIALKFIHLLVFFNLNKTLFNNRIYFTI